MGKNLQCLRWAGPTAEERAKHPSWSLGVWAPTTTPPGLISDELKQKVIPGCVCRSQRCVPRCSRPWAVDVVAVGWMMLGGLELVEVGVWGRNVNSRYAQAGWQGGRQGSLQSKEVQLPEAKLWFVTAQDSPSKITWARPARPFPLSHKLRNQRPLREPRPPSYVHTRNFARCQHCSILQRAHPHSPGPYPGRCITPRESGFLRCA